MSQWIEALRRHTSLSRQKLHARLSETITRMAQEGYDTIQMPLREWEADLLRQKGLTVTLLKMGEKWTVDMENKNQWILYDDWINNDNHEAPRQINVYGAYGVFLNNHYRVSWATPDSTTTQK